jgi:hypothetical protein
MIIDLAQSRRGAKGFCRKGAKTQKHAPDLDPGAQRVFLQHGSGGLYARHTPWVSLARSLPDLVSREDAKVVIGPLSAAVTRAMVVVREITMETASPASDPMTSRHEARRVSSDATVVLAYSFRISHPGLDPGSLFGIGSGRRYAAGC